ncbi:kinase subunit of RNA polymerase II carboxy-terminal domain kinase I [Serendipita sp. 399]|nr:kinase subunit of RNA polymerase II carboxy-terminal domain kinase I [Serendipita sp. 399]
MSQHHHTGNRRWRGNRPHSFSSQTETYQPDFGQSSGHRPIRLDRANQYGREDEYNVQTEDPSWGHAPYFVEADMMHRNDPPNPGMGPPHFGFHERNKHASWGQPDIVPPRGKDNSYGREIAQPFHGGVNHGPNVAMPQQWREPYPDPGNQWRDRDRDFHSDFDRSQPARLPMEWESMANTGWVDHPPAMGPPGMIQPHHQHQKGWSYSESWQDGPNHRPRHQPRHHDNRHSPTQNRRQQGYHSFRHNDNYQNHRSGYWNKQGHHYSNQRRFVNDEAHDHRNFDPNSKALQGSPRRGVDHVLVLPTPNMDAIGHSPPNAVTEVKPLLHPPNLHTAIALALGNQVIAIVTVANVARNASGTTTPTAVIHLVLGINVAMGSVAATMMTMIEGDATQIAPNQTATRIGVLVGAVVVVAIAAAVQEDEVGQEVEVVARHLEVVLETVQEVPVALVSEGITQSQTAPKTKSGAGKHRLPTKSAPKLPLLKDVPLAASRAVLPTNQDQITLSDSLDSRSRSRGPPTGPRAANTTSKQQSSLSQFFPDAGSGQVTSVSKDAQVPSESTGSAPAEKEGAKSRPRMVPIGENRVKPHKQPEESTLKEKEMPPPAPPAVPPSPSNPHSTVSSSSAKPPTLPPLVTESATTEVVLPRSPRSASPTKTAMLTPLPPETPAQATAPRPNKAEEIYKILNQVGEGTFGKVYKARNQTNGTHVALKRIRMEGEKDGFPVTAMREIKLLQSLKHENVVILYEMMVSKGIQLGLVFMVFEYVHHDLVGVLQQTQFPLQPQHLKALSHQMLHGLAYLHSKAVIHRDIKASNILINAKGELKLADFGLARFFQKRRKADYTNRVITLWYRPPELLFGATVYGPEVDLWSAGCIFLELFVKKPIFQGGDEIHQLDVIFRIMGSPTPAQWPSLPNLPWYELVKPTTMTSIFQHTFKKWVPSGALDLAQKMLIFDPEQRITAADAVLHPYFTSEEPPLELPDLSRLDGEWHELEAKRARRKRRTEHEVESSEVPSNQH